MKDQLKTKHHLIISDLKRAEETRQQAISLLTATLDSTTDGILVVDRQRKITSFNNRFLQMWQIRKEDIATKDSAEILSTVAKSLAFPEQFVEKILELYAKPEAESFDTLEFKDGRVFERSSRPQRIDEVIIGRVWSFRDVTEQKRAQAALALQENHYRALFDLSPGGILLLDENATILDANEAVCRAFGYTREDLVGHSIHKVVPPENRDRVAKHCAMILSGQTLLHEVENVRRDGSRIPVELRETCIRLPDGRKAILSVANDISERKRAEGVLQRYRLIVETAQEGIVASNVDFRITYVNRRFADMLGYSPEEMIGRQESDFMPEAEWEDHERQMNNRGGGENNVYERRYLRKDGSVVSTTVSATALLGEKGTFSGSFGMITDNTERIQSEERLRMQSAALEAVAHGVVITDHNGIITWVNPAFTALTGYTLEDALRNPMHLLSSGQQDPRFYSRLWETILEGNVWRGELINKRKDGTLYVDRQVITPLRDNNGNVTSFIAIKEDMTEHRRAIEALQQSEERFAKAFRASPIAKGIIRARDTCFIDINDAFLNLFGYVRDEVIGHTPIELVIYDNPDMLRTLLQGHRSVRNCEARGRTKARDLVNLVVSTEAITLDSEPHILTSLFDITARNRAEEEVRRLNASLELRVLERTTELQDAVTQMESFSYTVSHDLRAPLRAIEGYARIVCDEQSGKLDESGKDLLDKIRKNAVRMAELIDDLLAFSRLSRAEISKTGIDMKKLFSDAVSLIREENKGRKINVTIAELHQAYGDLTLLRQVAVNLVSNAFKFTLQVDDAWIDIGSYEEGSSCVYFVKDNGKGFDMQYAAKLFGVFQRLHGAHEFEGTGVGLAIVRRIVQRHAGRVWAEGAPEKGATFFFALPRSVAQAT